MKTLEINKMESLQGGEVTSAEACGLMTGVSAAFIASGFLSVIGVATAIVAVAYACRPQN